MRQETGYKQNKSMNIIFKVLFSRTMITMCSILLQIFILFAGFYWLSDYMKYIMGGFTVLSAVLVIYIINEEGNPAFKLAWILPVCIFPVFGALLYIFVHFNIGYIGLKKAIKRREEETKSFLKSNQETIEKLQVESPQVAALAHYMENTGGYPIYENTDIEYYALGEDKFEAMKVELEKANKFIFLEYFIVERGYMWDSLLEILERKAKEGVEVRVMYDGMCSLVLLPYKYPMKLQAMGIKAKMFSPIKPMLSTHQNNRDHRKILVIDGKVAFNGGVNLADEYINKKLLFGHWKDTAVKLSGDAVKSFTLMFLQLWNAGEKGEENYEKYIYLENTDSDKEEREEEKKKSDKEIGEGTQGYIMPYGDGPTNDLETAETVYIDILNTAKDYVHIMTPYLILDNEFITALTYAARRGVDVKVLLPHIPDKKSAFSIARTHYPQLLKAGVKIFEYTPGFVHAKCFVSDDEKAVVGTINLDYRSLFLHFECGTFIYRNPIVKEIAQDYVNTLEKSQAVTLEDYYKSSLFMRIMGRVLRLLGPLM